MNLPYAFRLICLVAVWIGAICLALQLMLAGMARPILGFLRSVSARQRERVLYLVQMGPLLAAVLFAGALCVPQYLRHEPNYASEGVSGPCLLLACAVFLWFGFSVLGGLRLTVRTLRFTRACTRAGTPRFLGRSRIAVLTLPGADSIFALAGFIHPVVFVSSGFTETGGMSRAALELALEHERAHAAHWDNWKRLFLSFLPRLSFGSGFWMRHWQEAAEWAADDEAVGGDPVRSLLLAETLLKAARCAASTNPPIICTAFYSQNAGLTARVERLVEDRRGFREASWSALLVLSGLAIGAVAVAAAVSPWIYAISEYIVHLG